MCVCVCVCVHACALAHVLSHSVVSDSFATLWTIACQAPLSIGLSRQQCWSGWPFQGLCSFCLAYLGKLILATQGPHLCPYFGNCFSSARTWLTYKCSQRPSLMTVTPLSLGWAERPSFVVRDSWPSFHPALNSTVLTVLMSALTDDGSCLTHHCMPGSQHSSSMVGCLLNWWVNKWMDGWIRMRKLKVKVAQSCLTLCDPMDYTFHGILQASILEWVAFPFSKESSQSRDRTQVSFIADGFFTSWATRKAQEYRSG